MTISYTKADYVPGYIKITVTDRNTNETATHCYNLNNSSEIDSIPSGE